MATSAAALIGCARREIQHRFFEADAVRPDRAIAFMPGNGFEQRQFDELTERKVVRSDANGKYWLDIPAYDEWMRQRFARTRLLLIAVLMLFALLAAFEPNGFLR